MPTYFVNYDLPFDPALTASAGQVWRYGMAIGSGRSGEIRVAIIGAGPGGLCMGIRLKQAGIEDFVILERASGVGGTWFHNRYPGCAVDLPSYFYSFSFEKKYDWSRPYAPQSELLEYMEGIAEKYDLLGHCRFEQGVESATWQDAEEGKGANAHWSLKLASGEELHATSVVSAVGMFNELVYPEIPGIENFEGPAFHSARWDWDQDLVGKRIGLIGSAASAVQIVPEVAKTAGQLHLFQRTANWILPKEDEPYTAEELEAFRKDPAPLDTKRHEMFEIVDQGMTFKNTEQIDQVAAAGEFVLSQVEDPVVREKLRPLHPYGCKRPLLSNTFYPAINQENVELVTESIECLTQNGIRTVDGVERAVDLVVYATGFAATKYLSALDVRGRNGRHIDEAWSDGANAYLGITTAGFPNLFMLYGPNTNNGSILEMIEYQTSHVLAHIERMERENLAWVDVKPEAQERYNKNVQAEISEIPVWNHPVNGYYRSESGRVVTQWPYSMTEFREMTETLDPDAYEVGPALIQSKEQAR